MNENRINLTIYTVSCERWKRL